eukprot:8594929-Lingulodinium_polyedra.AAC.1
MRCEARQHGGLVAELVLPRAQGRHIKHGRADVGEFPADVPVQVALGVGRLPLAGRRAKVRR